jgi:type VI secretion system secreted protein VgrG
MNPKSFLSSLTQPHTQENRLFTLHTPLADGVLLLDQFQGTETLSEPFRFTLQLLSERADLAPKELMGKPMGVTLRTASGADRWFHGHVTSFSHTGSDGGFAGYQAELGPWTDFLKHRINCKLFQDMNLPAILREVFKDYGRLARTRFNFKEEEYPPITLCVQYQESDFQFITRLLEAHGLYYYFKFEPDSHVLVLANESRAAPAVPEAAQIAFNSIPGAATEDTIDAWSLGERLTSTDYSTRRSDFKNPRERTEHRQHTSRETGAAPAMEHYDPSGPYGFKDFAAGEKLARLRMEQTEQRGASYHGSSNLRTLTCGHSFELRDHYRKTDNIHDRLFLVTQVSHTGTNNYLNHGTSSPYRNDFSCAPRSICYRPALAAPRPVIQGPQTATVVGPPGEEIHCDQYGRVRIQFHWDRLGKSTDASSCWVRVSSPMAGARFGFIAVPRIGQEVVVEFLDGNPDRPIITGCVYNELMRPPWDLPENQTQSGILTRSSKEGDASTANALRFEDKKGAEEVWLHAEKDQRIEVEHDESHEVGHDRRKAVGNDESTEIGNDRTEQVGANESISIGINQRLEVGAAQRIHIGATKNENVLLSSTEQVGGVRTLTVGAAYLMTVGAAKTEVVGLDSLEEVGHGKTSSIGKVYTLKVGDEFVIEVGKSRMVMTKDGKITLEGTEVTITGGGPVKVFGKNVEIN